MRDFCGRAAYFRMRDAMNIGQRVVVLFGGLAFATAAGFPPWVVRLPHGISEFAEYGPVWDGPRWSLRSGYPERVSIANAEWATVDTGRLGATLTAITGLTIAFAVAFRTRRTS